MKDSTDYTPRDDLESLAYTFMFIVNSKSVPWAVDTENEIVL